jgi:mono/diheme cytochrome c family protein
MVSMRIALLAIALVYLALCSSVAAQSSASTTPAAVERGRYLVEDVVMCSQCHTPRTETGELDRARWLMGGPVFYQPGQPIADWADVVPRIAGDPPGTAEDFIRLMTTGTARSGAPPRPPMLRLHMTRADAEAILAYLKSLAAEKEH